jgi:hypothetical protein
MTRRAKVVGECGCRIVLTGRVDAVRRGGAVTRTRERRLASFAGRVGVSILCGMASGRRPADSR